MVDHVVAEIQKKKKLDVSGDDKALARIRVSCEKAKRALSSNAATTIEVVIDGDEFSLEFTRSTFESLNEEIFGRTLDTVKRVLKDAKMESSDIDDVVLVGGSTRIPQLQDSLKKYFGGKELCRSINPDEAVAYGAAVQAAILSGVRHPACTDLLLVDVTPLSLGIELEGRQMSVILPRNTAVPCRKTRQFTTDATEAFQDFLKVRVFEGERPSTDANHLLGQFNVEGIEKARAGVPEILVTFSLDANGTLNVTAMDKKTEASNTCVITGTSKGLSPEEVQRMVDEAELFAKEDEEMRQKYILKNELENLAFTMPTNNQEELLAWLDEVPVAQRSVEDFEAKRKYYKFV
jgi:L1 cell adhesion molecule like protein